jgi:hypothetical protein
MCKRFRQNFDRYVAPEIAVVRLIDFAHSACADSGEHFVCAEFGTSG